MKMTRKKSSKKEISEESQWYRMKMARYYEEEWDKLFKTKSKQLHTHDFQHSSQQKYVA